MESIGFDQDNVEALKQLLAEPKRVVITTHHKPDADALGSSLGWAAFLQKLGHTVDVITPTDFPSFLNWMKGSEDVVIFNEGQHEKSLELLNNADIVFMLDFSALSRINDLGPLVDNAPGIKVLVDHHLEPGVQPDLKFWSEEAAATAQLIFLIIEKMDMLHLLDKSIAECLYAGIMTDTGSFRHPKTNMLVHSIIGRLIEIGADNVKIHRLIYDNNSLSKIRFLGYALYEKLIVLPELRTAYIAITAAELKEFNIQTGDSEGIINFALSIREVVMATIIIDRTEMVKMSFRSAGSFSVNDFARANFEGGGHRNAAGGVSTLTLDETVAKFLEVLPRYKDELLATVKN